MLFTHRGTVVTLVMLLAMCWLPAQFQKRYVPLPLRVSVPYEKAWKQMHTTLENDIKLGVGSEDLPRGEIITEFREYISGPMTRTQLAKISDPPKLIDGDWTKARFRYEIRIELIEARKSVVSVDTHIQGRKREFLGNEEWIDVKTNGRLEAELLTAFGKNLFGPEFALEKPKKGFWERDPEYVPDPSLRIPKTAQPERPPE